MQDESNRTKSAMCLGWLKNNVVRETPVIGHILTERTWDAFHHDMKHLFSMLVGMAAMMVIPMPMIMSKNENKDIELVQKFLLMTLYMYAGMFIGGVVFNIAKSGLSLCKSVPAVSAPQENDISEHEERFLNGSIGYAA